MKATRLIWVGSDLSGLSRSVWYQRSGQTLKEKAGMSASEERKTP